MRRVEQRVAEQRRHHDRGAELGQQHEQPPVECVRERAAHERDGDDGARTRTRRARRP
jgi:hypothetical protein